MLYQLSYLGVGRSSNTGESFSQGAPIANPFGVGFIPLGDLARSGASVR